MEPSITAKDAGFVQVPAGNVTLEGNLVLPAATRGVVLFAHGSGSSRHSPRNIYVARQLQEAGLGTLLIDLLTHAEEEVDLQTMHLRFDIGLLAERLIATTHWLRQHPATAPLRIGYFGASTGAGAALVAAARLASEPGQPSPVSAIVSRGGRPDLAGEDLARVTTPSLLIVGELDVQVLYLNQHALAALAAAEKELVVIPGATHLFEEPGTLEEVARIATDWFQRYLA